MSEISTTMFFGKKKPLTLCFTQLFEPRAFEDGAEEKYSVRILIPKGSKEIAEYEKIINALKEQARGKLGGKLKKDFKEPMRDGDDVADEYPEHEDHFFINANSTKKPGIIWNDKKQTEITDEDEVYSGMIGRVQVNFYLYPKDKPRGIACGLQNVQKCDDGERLGGGRQSAKDAFANFTDGGDKFGDEDLDTKTKKKYADYEDDDEDEAPKKKSSKEVKKTVTKTTAKNKKYVEDDDDEDEDY